MSAVAEQKKVEVEDAPSKTAPVSSILRDKDKKTKNYDPNDEHVRWFGKPAEEVKFEGECPTCGGKLDEKGMCGHESGGN